MRVFGEPLNEMIRLFKRPAKPTFDEALLNQLFRYAFSLCHDEAQAFDLVQHSCEKSLSNNSDHVHSKPFMMKVIRHAFIDQYRRKRFELVKDITEIESSLEEESHCLKTLEELHIDKQNVAIILDQVSPQERELLYLWTIEGMSIQEIADMTETPKGTLLARLSRLRKRLVKQFEHLVEREA